MAVFIACKREHLNTVSLCFRLDLCRIAALSWNERVYDVIKMRLYRVLSFISDTKNS